MRLPSTDLLKFVPPTTSDIRILNSVGNIEYMRVLNRRPDTEVGPIAEAIAFEPAWPQRTGGWFEERYNSPVSGSTVGIVNGVVPYRIPYAKYNAIRGFWTDEPDQQRRLYGAEMCGAIARDKMTVGPFAANHMFRGVKLECVVVRIIERRYNAVVLEMPSIPHPQAPWMRASPDGLIEIPLYGGGVREMTLEAKVPLVIKDLNIEPSYWQQIQMQMGCARADSSLFSRLDFAVFDEYVWNAWPLAWEACFDDSTWVDDGVAHALDAIDVMLPYELSTLSTVEEFAADPTWLPTYEPRMRSFHDRVLATRLATGMTHAKYEQINAPPAPTVTA